MIEIAPDEAEAGTFAAVLAKVCTSADIFATMPKSDMTTNWKSRGVDPFAG
ncbi:MAG TPA: hypothetical protein VGL24_04905 [Chthoniobacterales bacterium]|jgi:hypothetical protein